MPMDRNTRRLVMPAVAALILGLSLLVAPAAREPAQAAVEQDLAPDPSRGPPVDSALPSPTVRRLQELFSDMGLYGGGIDGRINAELTDAIARYQRDAQLEVTGAPSDELVNHVENSGVGLYLMRRLDRISRDQKDRARAALMAQPETRELVAAPAAGASAVDALPGDGTEALAACVAAPSATCVLSIALATALGVDDRDQRDWALTELLRVHAVEGAHQGSMDAALRVAQAISDPRQVIAGLRRIAVAAAEAGDSAGALRMAGLVPSPRHRATALREIADRLAAAGDAEGTRAALDALSETSGALAEPELRASMLAQLAVGQWRGGAAEAAGDSLEQAFAAAEAARLRRGAERSDPALAPVATALARMERPAEALALAAELQDPWRRSPVYIAAAESQAREGYLKHARATVSAIEQPRFKVVALVVIATTVAQAGDSATAGELLAEATELAAGIEAAYPRAYAQSRIALALLDSGRPHAGMEQARSIEHPGLQAETYWRLALHPELDRDRRTRILAKRSADEAILRISGSAQRCHALADRALLSIALGHLDLARAALTEALAQVEGIDRAWARARALAKIGEGFLGLDS